MILVNGDELKADTGIFPNGEVKIKEPFIMGVGLVTVTLKWESDQDLINLMFLKEYLDLHPDIETELVVLYMPYSRMDRKILGDLFTLKSVCRMINAMHFITVTVCEPHSDVTTALLDRCKVRDLTMEIFRDHENTIKPDYVFYPDAGAQKRYHTKRYPNLVGHKVRNPQTGRIEKYGVLGVDAFKWQFENGATKFPTIAILDDLSSYGNTFIHAAKALKEMGAGDIYLIVAHAEKAIFKGDIFTSGLFKKVLTSNSIIDIKDGKGFNDIIIEDIY